jgi:hypothetical protein
MSSNGTPDFDRWIIERQLNESHHQRAGLAQLIAAPFGVLLFVFLTTGIAAHVDNALQEVLATSTVVAASIAVLFAAAGYRLSAQLPNSEAELPSVVMANKESLQGQRGRWRNTFALLLVSVAALTGWILAVAWDWG